MILATASHLADIQQTTNNIVGVALVLWGLGLFVLLIIISVRAALAVEQAKRQSMALEAIRQHLEQSTAILQAQSAQSAQMAAQIEATNNLTRQLLRAYGHEPEA